MHENNRQLSCQLAVIYEELCRAQGQKRSNLSTNPHPTTFPLSESFRAQGHNHNHPAPME